MTKTSQASLVQPGRVALLLYGSGLSALVYQIAWQREFRLVFGSSTAGSAAVLAIFIGGTGAGSLLLGKRSDASPRPLRLYSTLELAIAALAAVSPFLLDLSRVVYRALGGTFGLGMTLGTVLRLLLATLVLGAPTVLMGGTLPAAARSAESANDSGRRAVGLLYAANTLGAVVGATASTLVFLEQLGTRRTLWLAALLNAVVALAARAIDRRLPETAPEPPAVAEAQTSTNPLPPQFVLAFAALSGFLFFWLELVWYRLLGPLLGGSVYTFGVILAVVLLGIGIGGLVYGALGKRFVPSPRGLALTAALEALLVALPFALGDRIALLALALRPEPGAGFSHYVPGWLAVSALVALPAAIVAGAQYPLLVGLLGQGRRAVGSHLGSVGAANTLGAMAGSLLGGFVLVPWVGATGSLRVVCFGLLVMAGAAGYYAVVEKNDRRRRLIAAPVLGLLATALALAPGPSAALRHSPIGAGRVDRAILGTPAFARAWLQDVRRTIGWQSEGRESSVALDETDGLAMVVNGKIDGNARGDASTQVMGGLLGAILHPAPKSAMVIGFGTGSSAGWLGKVPAIDRVDVAELERSMLTIGDQCSPVNEDVLQNPKVRVLLGDAREILLTIPARYDVIFSEPSNPYRAGVASLFTREYYEAARSRLEEGGLFLQWVQVYEIDAETVRTIYATLASVFPSVETWYLGWSDLVLVGSMAPPTYDPRALGEKLKEEPYRRALLTAWRTEGVEGLFAHYVAPPAFARGIASTPGQTINTDDRNRVEFGFARHVGAASTVSSLFEPVRRNKEDRPALVPGASLDFGRVVEERFAQIAGEGAEPEIPEGLEPALEVRAQALVNYAPGNIEGALAKWQFQETEPVGPVELALVAEGLAGRGDDAVLPLLERHARDFPIEADVFRARHAFAKDRREEAVALLERAFIAYQRDPWPSQLVMARALNLARDIGQSAPKDAERLFRATAAPFSVKVLEAARRTLRVDLARVLPEQNACVAAFTALEPHAPWDEALLKERAECYARWKHPRAEEAAKDVDRFARCTGLRGWAFCL
ncbi:fused MFS/spermidine synthase [Polyangium aurulentum]|uniref:fused MFS/spermidine synthase n=1 Tax=Polyangium aurulentum TaxID=2567896 RepID=UPI0010AE158D|nr:fused MFS/spermidine synthase [Polyangium aurulentum]UQA55391.1 fused MFS/spermidine synthase [Polyangium aurulentum]